MWAGSAQHTIPMYHANKASVENTERTEMLVELFCLGAIITENTNSKKVNIFNKNATATMQQKCLKLGTYEAFMKKNYQIRNWHVKQKHLHDNYPEPREILGRVQIF
jgi:hypothetical protein